MRRAALVSSIVALFAPALAQAAPTDHDSTFGPGGAGVNQITFSQGASEGVRVALEPSGKIVIAGARHRTTPSNFQDWVVARLDADGTALDSAFNGNGKSQPVATTASATSAGAESLLVQPDGNILVGGHQTGNPAAITVGRLHGDGTSDGTADTGFGASGLATISVTNVGEADVRDLALQPDGKIIAAGDVFFGGHRRPFVARFTSTGSPDTTFDSIEPSPDGVIFVPDSACDDLPVGIPADCDGHSVAVKVTSGNVTAIYLGGGNVQGDLIEGLVWKLAPSTGENGFALDTSNWAPSSVTPGGAPIERHILNDADAMVLTADGGVVVAGLAQNAANSASCGIAKLTPVGGLDGGFAHEPIDPGGTNGSCSLGDLVQQGDGRFVFSGFATDQIQFGGSPSVALGRWTADGHADGSFAPGGGVLTALGAAPNYGEGMTLQDGRPLVTGVSGNPNQMSVGRFLGGDLPGGGGSPGGGGGSAPTATGDPEIVGIPQVGQLMYCAPGAWDGATSFEYTWARVDAAGQETEVSRDQVYKPVDLDSGHRLRCFVTAHGPSGVTGRYSSNEPVIVLQLGVVPPPALQLRMPRVIQRLDAKLHKACKDVVCRASEVVEYLRDQGLNVDPQIVEDDPDTFPSNVDDIVAGMVYKQSPAPGAKLKSIAGAAVKVKLTVYEPKMHPRRCPVDRKITAGGDSFTLEELLKDQTLVDAENLLRIAKCVKLSKGGDESGADYTLDLRPDKGLFEPRVVTVDAKTVAGRKILVLVVRYPADQLGFVVEPDTTPGAHTLSLGKPELTVDKRHTASFVVGPQTPAGVGFRNAFVELRDEHGLQLDGAYTGVGGRVTLHGLIDHAGAYTIVARVEDPNGETLTGVQDVAAVDRKGQPWVSATGQTFAGNAANGYGAARTTRALSGAQEDSLRARFQPLLQAYGTYRTPNAFVTRAQQDVLDTFSVDSDAYRFGLYSYEQFVKQGFSPVSVALGGAGTLDATTPTLAKTGALVATGSGLAIAHVSSFRPGNGAFGLRFTRDGLSLIVFPDGSYTFQSGGGNLLAGGVPRETVVDAKGRQFNVAPLISNDGASLITNDGASLITNDGASLITNDGASLIGNDGASIVAQGAGNLSWASIVAQGGGNIVAQGGGNIVAQGGGNIVAQGGGNIVSTSGSGR